LRERGENREKFVSFVPFAEFALKIPDREKALPSTNRNKGLSLFSGIISSRDWSCRTVFPKLWE
jgi:hypothetical protein